MGGGGGSRKADLMEIDVFANRRMCSKTQRGNLRSCFSLEDAEGEEKSFHTNLEIYTESDGL